MAKNGVGIVVLAGLAMAAAFGGCTTLRMAVPADVEAASETFEAEGRSWASGSWVDESFRIGPFSVEEVDRSGTRETASSSIVEEGWLATRRSVNEELEGAYAFRFREGETELRASCHTFTNLKTSTFRRVRQIEKASRLACACERGAVASTLELQPSASGTLTLRGRSLELTSVRTSNSSWATQEPAGFRVDGEDGAVGAVEILRPGRLWLSRKLDADERRDLACLLSALMLHVEE